MSARFADGVPRLNHVAMSLPAERLSPEGRAEIVEFYGDCFDWTELAEQTVDRERLVLAVGHWDHFVFLHAERESMRAPRLDHFGMSVRSRADLDGAWSRVAAWAGRDDRIDTIDPHVDDFGPVKIHAFYVRHLLPLTVEVQYWEMT